jgi:hypothetical protein
MLVLCCSRSSASGIYGITALTIASSVFAFLRMAHFDRTAHLIAGTGWAISAALNIVFVVSGRHAAHEARLDSETGEEIEDGGDEATVEATVEENFSSTRETIQANIVVIQEQISVASTDQEKIAFKEALEMEVKALKRLNERQEESVA